MADDSVGLSSSSTRSDPGEAGRPSGTKDGPLMVMFGSDLLVFLAAVRVGGPEKRSRRLMFVPRVTLDVLISRVQCDHERKYDNSSETSIFVRISTKRGRESWVRLGKD